MNDNEIEELKRLKFEDFLWVIFALLALMNIYGDNLQKQYLNTHLQYYEKEANDVFLFTLIVTLLIYIYFFIRNEYQYKNASLNTKNLFAVKWLGSAFLIAGAICLIYFQKNNENFIGSPSL